MGITRACQGAIFGVNLTIRNDDPGHFRGKAAAAEYLLSIRNMPISQNAQFTGEADKDREYEHPKGASIARAIKSILDKNKWMTKEIDNWRDCGWSIECSRANDRLEIAIADNTDNNWMLQIAPFYTPGLLGRLFGKTPSATSLSCYELSCLVDSAIRADSRYTNIKWRWDGFPEESNSTPSPTKP
jgi:hypothetical protein